MARPFALGPVSGGVNPAALAFAAALFLCVARAWRRGVTIVSAAVAWSLLGQLVTIAFFYS